MGRRPQPERRADLLAACADELLRGGLSELTLARLASAAGTSPRMLIYHFATRDGLVIAALQEARCRQRELFDGLLEPRPGVGYAVVLREAWAQMTAPDARPYLRLFRELHDLPADRTPWAEFRTLSIADWLPIVEAGLLADGRPDAKALASALVACARGLFSDLDTTGDSYRTTAAWHAIVDLLARTPTRGG